MTNKDTALTPTETQFNLRLGDKIYTLNFAMNTFRRIKEARPELTTAFHVLDEMVTFEAIPFLIEAAIKPEDRGWTSEDEFIELYDNCQDPAISKVMTAYISAAQDMSKKIAPAIAAVQAMQKVSEPKSSPGKK